MLNDAYVAQVSTTLFSAAQLLYAIDIILLIIRVNNLIAIVPGLKYSLLDTI